MTDWRIQVIEDYMTEKGVDDYEKLSAGQKSELGHLLFQKRLQHIATVDIGTFASGARTSYAHLSWGVA
jgi:hypothetical protein